MLKFFDVLDTNDPEILAKQTALGGFSSILLHDPRVLDTLGTVPDVINDPDQVSSTVCTISVQSHPHTAGAFRFATGCAKGRI
jgi:hypothetical protein